ncbi:interleukin-11 receptor subunit alpha-like isoform X2 [Lethenteron reissneri]|uniref:interleukin-11 receptor subunit alpha-like isoform X2 n=1 Tax=Lethenteron reissneri TaxID=7753 RepID=UPI002AB67C82|nr:interleukin-11 receptor subunit alpha-like isoform X2 [Lethenteron reissneri]
MEKLLIHVTLLLGAVVESSLPNSPDPAVRRVYGAVGSPITVTCGPAEGRLQGNDIAWRWNGDVLSLGGSAKADGAHLTLGSTSPASAGTYSCHSHASGKEVDRILLEVGYHPEKPNITCRSYNYPESFQCTWEAGRDTLLRTNVSATYRHPMSQTFLPCEPTGDRSCTGSDLMMYSSMAHVVTARITNPLGSAEGHTHFVLENIIQPDAPVNVSARAAVESAAVTVSWRLPASWFDPFLFPLQHRLRFRLAESGDAWRTTLFPGESVEEQELRGLRPRTRYEVQVSLKDLLDYGHWSEWSESAFVHVAGSRRPGYPPSKPTVTCRSFDYPERFECEWQSSSHGNNNVLNTSYSASYRNPLTESWLPCVPVADNACQGRDVTLFSEQPHELTVTATNPFGSVEVHHAFLLEDIVQPDPPINVQARWRDVESVLVSWEQPTSWNPHPAFPLTYRLRYRTLGAQGWSKVLVDGEGATSFVLEPPPRAGAARALEVRVSAREALGTGTWSRWSLPARVIDEAH